MGYPSDGRCVPICHLHYQNFSVSPLSRLQMPSLSRPESCSNHCLNEVFPHQQPTGIASFNPTQALQQQQQQQYATIPNDAPPGERTSVSRAIARDAAGTRRAQKCSEYTTNVVALPEKPFGVGSPVRPSQGFCADQSQAMNSFEVKRRLLQAIEKWHGFGTMLIRLFSLLTLYYGTVVSQF